MISPSNNVSLEKKLLKRYQIARYSLVAVIVATVINIVLLLCNQIIILPFSATVPYYLSVLAVMAETQTQLWLFLPISVSFMVVYLVSALLSRLHYSFIIAAAALHLVDTVGAVYMLTLRLDASGVIDVVVHIAVVAILVIGAVSRIKLAKILKNKTK